MLYEVRSYQEDEYDEYEDADAWVNDRYERLCLLSNEQLNLDGRIYSKVIKIMYNSDKKDMNVLDLERRFNISIWSNGALHWHDQRYLIYWKGIPIGDMGCPPSWDDVKSCIQTLQYKPRGSWEGFDELKQIGDLLGVLKVLDDNWYKFRCAIAKSTKKDLKERLDNLEHQGY